MKDKIKKILISLAVLVFWLCVWEICARIIDLEFVLPTVTATEKALSQLMQTKAFYITIQSSLLRIFSSFILGVIIAIILAFISIKFKVLRALIMPLMTVAKSTPVAVIIIILWMMIGGANVPGAIAILMVLPVIWQNLIDGYNSIDSGLDEVCKVYKFSFIKRFKILVLPAVLKFFLPAVITASGLAWKAGIAAEVICITKNSIGKEIYNAKYILDGPGMFAYTVFVLILSCMIEMAIKILVERIRDKCRL
jgi:NitT/TauT family transport system permease protein